MNVWRLHTKTGKGSISEYCLNNSVAALGWSLDRLSEAERNNIKTFDEYLNQGRAYYKKELSCPKRFHNVEIGDLIWLRHKGIYSLGRVSENTKWQFNTSDEATKIDACNQLTNIKWYNSLPYSNNLFDEASVPGAISTSFILGSAFEKIHKSGVQEYSCLLYDKLAGTNYYPNITLELKEECFYSLLSTDDCEDLLCLWLYKKYGYICIPSTDKKGTQTYECVLIDPKNGNHIYIQVKKGNDDLDTDDYKDLKGEVWLLTTNGKIFNSGKNQNVKEASSKELFDFAFSKESDNILSDSIKTWAEFLVKNSNDRSKTK